jgi:hypothetical protein
MTSTELTQKYGQSITPIELAKFLGIDERTVKKYSHIWGGVEVAPGLIRFFEYRVRGVLNAKFDKEKGKIKIPGKCNGQGSGKPKIISGCNKKIIQGSNSLGKRRKRKNGKATIPDKFGIFNDC